MTFKNNLKRQDTSYALSVVKVVIKNHKLIASK